MTTTAKPQAVPATATTATKPSTRKAPNDIKGLVQVMMPEIKKALPNTITPERFTRIATTALSSNPKLQACSPMSFIGAMMQSAQLGLEPNSPLGEAYLIPYGNQCQFQLGYKGMLRLAHNSGTQVDAHEVCVNDEFTYEYGLHPDLTHKPALENRGEVYAYYAVWRNGTDSGFIVSSKEDILKHAKKYSKSVNSGPWASDFDAMAKKTVIKQALKLAPLSADFMRAVSADETIKTKIDEHMDEVADETVWDVIEQDPETGEVQ